MFCLQCLKQGGNSGPLDKQLIISCSTCRDSFARNVVCIFVLVVGFVLSNADLKANILCD